MEDRERNPARELDEERSPLDVEREFEEVVQVLEETAHYSCSVFFQSSDKLIAGCAHRNGVVVVGLREVLSGLCQ